jgi:hypothetical protein
LNDGLLSRKEERVNSNRRTVFYRLTKKSLEMFSGESESEEPSVSNPQEDKEGYLYIMYETKAKTIKIGKSKNTPQREQSLNSTKMPMRVYLCAQVKSPYWVQAEKVLHDLYEDYCVDPYETSKRKTEWFDLCPTEIACLMLLTPSHLEEMVVRRNIPKKSLTELIEGTKETFLNPSVSYTDLISRRREYMISQLHQVISDKSLMIQRYEEEITNLRLKLEMGDDHQKGSGNRIRSALRAIATTYDNESLFPTEDNVTTENSENIVNN